MGETVMKNNKGYSFIELIIVVAIIAIASAMSITSVNIINSARAKDAAIKFDAEISELIQKNKNMRPSGSSDTAKYGILLYIDSADDKYKICQVECDHYTSDDYYVYKTDASNYPILNNPVEISKRVSIAFEGTYTTFCKEADGASFTREAGFKPSSPNGTGAISIMFDKQGNCISGYGTYEFKKVNGNTVGNTVSRVTIRKNGSHEVK